MTYDHHVPKALKELQAWFSGIITQPIDSKSHIKSTTPSGTPIAEEAKRYIRASSTMQPSERIEIYNQQYWWRLLNTLHDIFPLAIRLLGYRKFNRKIAIPFLFAYPSENWSLNHLGDRLPFWMQERYEGEDKQILFDATAIDQAFNSGFFAAHKAPITAQRTPEEAFKVIAQLQPHLCLFALEYDLLRFRREIKEKDPDFWSNHHYPNLKHALCENEHHFPTLQRGDYHFIIYRTPSNQMVWDDLNPQEHALLSQFHEGSSIEQCCQSIQRDQSLLEEAKAHLQKWIEKWIALEWLTEKGED